MIKLRIPFEIEKSTLLEIRNRIRVKSDPSSYGRIYKFIDSKIIKYPISKRKQFIIGFIIGVILIWLFFI
jgi:hypothetical protein